MGMGAARLGQHRFAVASLPRMSDTETSRELIRLQIEELWGQGRTSLVHEIYDPAVTDHMPLPGQPQGLDALAEVVERFHAAIPDLVIEVHAILADGNRASDVWTLTGTHSGTELMGVPPSGNALRFSGLDCIAQRGGLITDIWHAEELMQMEEQLRRGP